MPADMPAALTAIYVSILTATALATRKPVGALSAHLLSSIAEDSPPELAELLLSIAAAGEDAGEETDVDTEARSDA